MLPRAMTARGVHLLVATLAMDAATIAAWFLASSASSFSIFPTDRIASSPWLAAASATRAALALVVCVAGPALRPDGLAGTLARLAHSVVAASFVARAVLDEDTAACVRHARCGPADRALVLSALVGLVQVFALEDGTHASARGGRGGARGRGGGAIGERDRAKERELPGGPQAVCESVADGAPAPEALPDTPWCFEPALEPEPWREGVPEHHQRMIERTFAVVAREIAAILAERDGGASAPASAARPSSSSSSRPFRKVSSIFAPASDGGRVRVWTRAAEGDERARKRPPVMYGVYDVPVSVPAMDAFISRSDLRSGWDPFCKSGAPVSRANTACQIVRQEFHPRLIFSGREQYLLAAGRRLRNGGSLFVSVSVPAEETPEVRPGLVRSHQFFAAHYVSPRRDDDDPGLEKTKGAPPPRPFDGEGCERTYYGAAKTRAVTVASVVHLDLRNGMPRWFYWFVGRQFGRVMMRLRRASVRFRDAYGECDTKEYWEMRQNRFEAARGE